MSNSQQWTSAAGPLQTKRVNAAIGALKWRGRTRVELRGVIGDPASESRSELTAMCAPESAESLAALDAIGEKYGHTVTRENAAAIVYDLEAAAAALVLPVDDVRRAPAEVKAQADRAAESDQKWKEERRAAEASAAALMAKKPDWAAALIIAELRQDDSDSMTDYFAHSITRVVAIGWRKGKREDFRQLRAAAAGFPGTEHLGPGCGDFSVRSVWESDCPKYDHYAGSSTPIGRDTRRIEDATYSTREAAQAAIDSTKYPNGHDCGYRTRDGEHLTGRIVWKICESEIEHRENYSMGGGNYLARGSRHSSGWAVRSVDVGHFGGQVIEDCIPEAPAAAPKAKPAPANPAPAPVPGASAVATLTKNIEKSGIELRFAKKPAAETLDALKAAGWRWTRFGQCWYAKDTVENANFAARFLELPADPPIPYTESNEIGARFMAGGVPGNTDSASVAPLPASAPADGWGSVATKLSMQAGALQRLINHAERPMAQNPTPKRTRDYQSRMHEAGNLRRTQKAMRALAAAHTAGTCPAILLSLRKRDDIARLVRHAATSNNYYHCGTDDKPADTSPAGVALQTLAAAYVADPDAGHESPEAEAERLRLAKIKALELDLIGCNIPGFFPTPRAVVEKMLDAAEIESGMMILEPSAGIGSIADVIREQCPDADTTCIEINSRLREVLAAKGHSMAARSDFLDAWGSKGYGFYDRVIMNPPFENGQDAEHVTYAFRMLNPGGRLVAIMSEGVFYRSDRKSVEFREFLDSIGGTSEKLEPGAFTGASAFRQTGVACRLVVIDKPGERKPLACAEPRGSEAADVEPEPVESAEAPALVSEFDWV